MPLTPLPRKRILTAAAHRTSTDSTGMSLPRPASSTLPYRRPRYRWTLHSIRNLCRAHPLIVFFVATYFLLFLRPLWFYATHARSHGFLAQPIPANHHIIGFLHRHILPSFLVRILYRFGSGRGFAYQFPIPEITNARSPSEWPLPELTRPVYRPRRKLRHRASTVRIHDEAVMNQKTYYELVSPAYLAFHTFSIANSTKAREFRDLSRQQQRKRIPEEYTHLIDWQFVLASPPNWAEEVWAELEAEQAEHGDLLVLDEFAKDDEERMPENMNDGKTYRWMQEVIKRAEDGRGRSALWVMKTDTDTYHILPNLVRFLESYPAAQPTFFGSSYGTSYTPNSYFQGLGYGMSWGLLRTLVDANIPHNLTVGHEDHITGSWMWSLPAQPQHSQKPHQSSRISPVDNIMAFTPPSPDPCTSLVRADFYERASSWYYWWIPKTERMIIAHGMKTQEEYMQAVTWTDNLWLRPNWIGQRAHSEYMWQPPERMRLLTLKPGSDS